MPHRPLEEGDRPRRPSGVSPIPFSPTSTPRSAAPGADWNVVARDTLFALAYPGQGSWPERADDRSLPAASRLALAALDPRNITLEPEYYAEVDAERFARVKPLLWLWYSFDRLPIGGQHVALGVEFRRLLAPRIFARVGANFKCFQHVEFSFGYQLEVGDDVVVHRHVLLDDRGGITLGNRVSISDYANIYSHTHSIVDQKDVTSLPHRARRRRPHHLPRHGPGRGAGRTERHGRRRGTRHPRRPPLSRLRRHSRQVDPRQAERPAPHRRDPPGPEAQWRGPK